MKMQNKPLWKILAILLVLLMVVSCTMPSIAVDNASGRSDDFFPSENITADNTPFLLSSNTYYVPDDYEKIQWAVDNASAGDTIIVRDGTYTENINVNEAHLTIISENGPDKTIVKAANPDDRVFEVIADYVNISGFTVKGATGYAAGLCLYADYCNISNNNCSNNGGSGIYLGDSNNNSIANNICLNNSDDGISLWDSNNNSIANNICRLNNDVGIDLYDPSNNNTISNNNCSSNGDGIALMHSNNNSVSNNICLNNLRMGIDLSCSNNSIISNNNCTNNYYGIRLGDSSNNSISNNICSLNNASGILLLDSNNNTVYLNNFINNTLNSASGILLFDSNNNTVYLNNFINNTDNVYSDNSTNIWNSTEKITYTHNGSTYTNYTGNYWDDYVFAGNDTNKDGIGDTPYIIPNDNNDNYPLMDGFENYIKEEIERIYGIPVDFRYNNNLRKGNNHPEVRYLQIILNIDPDTQVTTSGAGSPGNETTYFGSLTEKAVIKFQEKYAKDILEPLGLASGTGFVGEKTRTKLNYILDKNFTEDYKKKFDLLNETERKSAIWSYINESYKDYGLPEDFPKELILAIATQETGGYAHWNNEHVADDWGRGIMQVTSDEYVGAGGVDTEFEDCKKCKDREGKIYCSKYYSNTLKGIEANIKDGLYALSDKYSAALKHPPKGYDDISAEEMLWISTVQRYNTRKLHPTEYINAISDKLDRLASGEYGQFDGFDTQVANSLSAKFRKAYENSQSIRLYSPAELHVCDYEGNITGLVEGEIKEEIPNSIYDNVTKTILMFSSHDCYYEVVGTDTGTYGLNMISVENGKETDFSITNISTMTNTTHQYIINWTAYSQGEEGVTLKIDSDGDGEFEETIEIQPPIANFTYTPENPVINQKIIFNASNSTDQDGFISNYEWNFGDGTNGCGKITTHSYSSAGEYIVTLTVIDNSSAINLTSKMVNIPKTSPCFIATASYGTPLHEDIDILRDFRDEYLMTNSIGRAFVKIYYTLSPPIADVIRENERLRTAVREGLVKPLVYISRVFVW